MTLDECKRFILAAYPTFRVTLVDGQLKVEAEGHAGSFVMLHPDAIGPLSEERMKYGLYLLFKGWLERIEIVDSGKIEPILDLTSLKPPGYHR